MPSKWNANGMHEAGGGPLAPEVRGGGRTRAKGGGVWLLPSRYNCFATMPDDIWKDRLLSEAPLSEKRPCPICGAGATVVSTGPSTNCECPACGAFRITSGIEVPAQIAHAVSAATRQSHEQGRTLFLNRFNMTDLAEPHLRTTVAERLDKLLAYLASKMAYPGSSHQVQLGADYPVADAHNENELDAYLNYLSSEKLIDLQPSRGGEAVCALTVRGWQRIQSRARPGGEPGRCFVACWLADDFYSEFRNAADAAIRACSYVPFWIVETRTNQGISDRVLAEIQRAEFVVADFTGQRQSVYFEAGFARGLGRQVIWCCKQDDVRNLHFDTKHLGHVVWKDSADLRAKLEDSIRANIITKA